MKHEIFDTVLNISDTNITFEGIYQKPYVPAEYMDDIKKANLLIIPNEGFRDMSKPIARADKYVGTFGTWK